MRLRVGREEATNSGPGPGSGLHPWRPRQTSSAFYQPRLSRQRSTVSIRCRPSVTRWLREVSRSTTMIRSTGCLWLKLWRKAPRSPPTTHAPPLYGVPILTAWTTSLWPAPGGSRTQDVFHGEGHIRESQGGQAFVRPERQDLGVPIGARGPIGFDLSEVQVHNP